MIPRVLREKEATAEELRDWMEESLASLLLELLGLEMGMGKKL